MADVSVKPEKRKKRKLASSEGFQNRQKIHRIDLSDEEKSSRKDGADIAEHREPTHELDEEERPWSNLNLILSLQNKELDIEKKVSLAFNCVKLRVERAAEADEDYETVKISRLIVFLGHWIQSQLISTDKKAKVDEYKSGSESFDACLDFRCWDIFKFCLEKSVKLQVSLNLSRNILRALGYIARHMVSLISDRSLHPKEAYATGKGFGTYRSVVDCVSLLFSVQDGLLNQNLDLWLSTVDAVLGLLQRSLAKNLEGDPFVLKFSCLILEPFSKFLKAHPTRKNGFRDFIEKLLEQLLPLIGVLRHKIDESTSSWEKTLLKLLEDILSQGLFQPGHIDGFLGLQTTQKYGAPEDVESENLKSDLRSYHRHLFDKLKLIVAAKKLPVSSGIGELFCLLVCQVRKQARSPILYDGGKAMVESGASKNMQNNVGHRLSNSSGDNRSIPEENCCSTSLDAETRKALFEFFTQLMEPLLLQMLGYIQAGSDSVPLFSDVFCTLKSANNLVYSLLLEKVYMKTEDISEGACLNFLKKVYRTIISVASSLLLFPKCDINKDEEKMFVLSAKELFVAVGYLFDIEYEVIENDTVSLWLMIISYMANGLSAVDAPNRCSLTSQILKLGCKLIDLYSELRQVDSTIFALCKAVRLLMCNNHDNDDGDTIYTSFLSCTASLPCHTLASSVGMLSSSQELRFAVHNAIKSIPEGQASGCIQSLALDIAESMAWLKVRSAMAHGKDFARVIVSNPSMSRFELQVELLGRSMCEIYTLILDSVTVTAGNSNLLGLSINNLMAVFRPCIGGLVGPERESLRKFLFTVTGGNFHRRRECILPTYWVIVFIFRLYLSCRSLYRQVISLMAPDASKKMLGTLGDSFIASSGNCWMEKTEWTQEGYFSWAVQPSASLIDIINCLSEIYLKDNVANCCPLLYVLYSMALQRLADLDRHAKAAEYLLQRNENLVHVEMLDDSSLPVIGKRTRQLRRHVSVLKQEAEDLTAFMIEYLSLVVDDQQSASIDCQLTFEASNGSASFDFCISAIDKNSLPSALWWVVCQNIDIWCSLGANKKLKKFLSLLIRTSIPLISISSDMSNLDEKHNTTQTKKVTMHQISSELLSDSVFYDYEFVRRNLPSKFCHLLEKASLELLDDFLIGKIDLESSSDWPAVLSMLDKSITNCSSSTNLPIDSCTEANISQLKGKQFTVCQDLLSLLCWMPKASLNSKSFHRYATSILEFERRITVALLKGQGKSRDEEFNLFKLFVSCRRTLKYVIMASCEKLTEPISSLRLPAMADGSLFDFWLFKSVYAMIGVEAGLLEGCDEARHLMFSLMDHTSYIFVTTSRHQFSSALYSFTHQQSSLDEPGLSLDFPASIGDCSNLFLIAEQLKEQAGCLLTPLKDALCSEKAGLKFSSLNLIKLSSIVSCFGGFLWGLASAASQVDVELGKAKWKCETVSKIGDLTNVFSDFISTFLWLLFVSDDVQPGKLDETQGFQELECNMDTLDRQHEKLGVAESCSSVALLEDGSRNLTCQEIKSKLVKTNSPADVLTEADLVETQYLNRHFIQGLLKGDCPAAAFSLRQLLIASAAVMRLKLHISIIPFSSKSMPVFVGISQVLLSGLADMVEVPPQFSFVWLDGILKYLEELGGHFPSSSPTLTRNVYSKLIKLHLSAIGKCISLQGKQATLASHRTESSNKILRGEPGSSDEQYQPYCLDEFKERLRMSFKVYVEKSSELHLLSALQAVERALVGVPEVSTAVYGIYTGNVDGGKVSSSVAGGIECLDLILEYASGRKRLNVVKRHIQSFVTALFNIIVHLQSPFIFCKNSASNNGCGIPDPGSVILMCVEVLTRISGKHALFHMDSWHVSQCIHIPGAVFQALCQPRDLISPRSDSNKSLDNQQHGGAVASMNCSFLDHKFSINLYAACCRLLYTVLKHHKSDTERCIVVLEQSVSVLLYCLEEVDKDSIVKKGVFSWDIEGVKCARFLRRIYEELRQQKDVFGKHCFKFLSTYIWVYSGLGPLKRGIRREENEALKPGVYALIDACSADDLQYLHTLFGEGPCRNNLSILQQDYKMNFQYEGKV